MTEHWITLVRERKSPAWELDPPDEVGFPFGGGGFAMIDDGRPLPGPKPCTWCGRVVKARVVERWTARSFRESIWGPGEHYSFDKPYKIPLKWLVYRHVCQHCEVHEDPKLHWVVLVWLKKTPGWVATPGVDTRDGCSQTDAPQEHQTQTPRGQAGGDRVQGASASG